MSFEVSHKSPEAFRTISEVAAELDLPQHVLRFWEGRFPQVHPLKRAGGRRYYRPEDIDLLRGIHKLLYGEGLTIRGVQKILREQGLRYVCGIGRGEIQFMTPLRRGAPKPTIAPPHLVESFESEMGFGFAGLPDDEEPSSGLEISPAYADDEQAEDADAIVQIEAVEETFVPAPDPRLEKRLRLEALLTELLELKARLQAAKARHMLTLARPIAAAFAAAASRLDADGDSEAEPAADCRAMG